jgi:hypothetical protein
MESYNRADPTPVIVQKGAYGSAGTGTYSGLQHVRIPFNTTSTGTAAENWINPEAGTVIATVQYFFSTAGTGTIDVGIASDGTGDDNGIIDGGTLTVGVHYPQEVVGTVAASAVKGGEDQMWFAIGPGGTGTNNTVVARHTDTVSSTASGSVHIIYYLAD